MTTIERTEKHLENDALWCGLRERYAREHAGRPFSMERYEAVKAAYTRGAVEAYAVPQPGGLEAIGVKPEEQRKAFLEEPKP